METVNPIRFQETIAMLKLLAQSQKSIARGEPFASSQEVRKRGRDVIERLAKL